MGKTVMRCFTHCLFLSIFLASCSFIQKPDTLEGVKADLICIEYKEGSDWKVISKTFGAPDIHPIPQPSSNLSANTRGYKDKILLFFTERKEVTEGDKIRFREVVTKVELCRKK
ncbi:MAG: hypothetical protein AB1442_02755 [Nitrospirota bacterium]